jgi:hypothetical protein
MSMPQHIQAVPPAAGAPQPWAMPTFTVHGTCPPQPENNTVPELAEDDEDDEDDADFWESNEIWMSCSHFKLLLIVFLDLMTAGINCVSTYYAQIFVPFSVVSQTTLRSFIRY